MKDQDVIRKVMNYLSKYIKDFENANVVGKQITRFPKSFTHFFPGAFLTASHSSAKCRHALIRMF
uniref:Phytoene desaturase 2 n=1 Tax=Bixa orellana TaxID=66672 RepID=A0A9Y0ZFS1_BIXOR|nr:phytoene desaturase 2 [Bixa orellana]